MIRLAIITLLLAATPAMAGTLTWAGDTDIGALDPDTRDETVQLAFLANIYEPLVRRDRNLRLEPALALSWRMTTPTTWRFALRPNVLWQDKTPFTADDVLFSWTRATSATSALRYEFGAIKSITAVDPLTIDLQTAAPDPILPEKLTNLLIMSRAWSAAHNAATPALIENRETNYAVDHAMGTGPFAVSARTPGKSTLLQPNPTWWAKPSHNLTRAEFDVIADPAARVAAIRAGKIDLITSVAPSTIALLRSIQGVRLLEMPGLRTVFFGMDMAHDQLAGSNIASSNPLKDPRVRAAIGLAIDETAIAQQDLHGHVHPTWLLWGPGVAGYDPALDIRPPANAQKAKAALAAAGFPNGFSVRMDCPRGKYYGASAICTDAARMLGAAGITVQLHIIGNDTYFRRLGATNFRGGLYLYGWTPATADALDSLSALASRRSASADIGGYENPILDELIGKIGAESDADRRADEIRQAAQILQQDLPYIPLHQQNVVWAARSQVGIVQSADDYLALRTVVTQ